MSGIILSNPEITIIRYAHDARLSCGSVDYRKYPATGLMIDSITTLVRLKNKNPANGGAFI